MAKSKSVKSTLTCWRRVTTQGLGATRMMGTLKIAPNPVETRAAHHGRPLLAVRSVQREREEQSTSRAVVGRTKMIARNCKRRGGRHPCLIGWDV